VAASFIKAVDDTIRSRFFWGYCMMVNTLAGFLTSLASWCEGCQCHEDELTSNSTYFLRSKLTRQEGTSCCYKGRRAPELAAGFLKQHVDWLASSAMTELLGFIEGLPPDQSSKILEDFHTACDRALLEIQVKTHHWEELPWALAVSGHHDVEVARAGLRRLRDKFLKTETSKHLVCMLFFQHKPQAT